MPTVSSSSMTVADRVTIGNLLGRTASNLMTASISSSEKYQSYSSTPPSSLQFSALETIDRMATLTTTTTTTTSNSLEMISREHDVSVSQSPDSLGLFEELGHWSTASNCTALIHALLASFSVILVSELGDKTFIITAIMAMKNSRSLVFISSASALLLMTILSVGMGVAVAVIPELYTHYASIVLFLCFGLKMLKEAYEMSTSNEVEGESEFDEVKRSLETEHETKVVVVGRDENVNELDEACADTVNINDNKIETIEASYWSQVKETLYVAPVIIKVFTMVFVAEWGDRSQISTVILAAREDVVGVFIGSLSGHVFCTGLAVIGGRFVADMISVRTMTLLGGITFLFFATFAILVGPEQQV